MSKGKNDLYCIIEQKMSAYPSGCLHEKQGMQKLEKRRSRKNERMKMYFSNYFVICTGMIYMQDVG